MCNELSSFVERSGSVTRAGRYGDRLDGPTPRLGLHLGETGYDKRWECRPPEGATVSLTRRSVPLIAVLPILSGCAGVPAPVVSGLPPQQARALVLVVDGAGGYQYTPRAIAQVVTEDHLPLAVQSFDWTHSYGRWLADQVDQDHSYAAGLQLADPIVATCSTVDTDLPRIRFVMDPLKPVFQGTRRIRESRVDE